MIRIEEITTTTKAKQKKKTTGNNICLSNALIFEEGLLFNVCENKFEFEKQRLMAISFLQRRCHPITRYIKIIADQPFYIVIFYMRRTEQKY